MNDMPLIVSSIKLRCRQCGRDFHTTLDEFIKCGRDLFCDKQCNVDFNLGRPPQAHSAKQRMEAGRTI